MTLEEMCHNEWREGYRQGLMVAVKRLIKNGIPREQALRSLGIDENGDEVAEDV